MGGAVGGGHGKMRWAWGQAVGRGDGLMGVMRGGDEHRGDVVQVQGIQEEMSTGQSLWKKTNRAKCSPKLRPKWLHFQMISKLSSKCFWARRIRVHFEMEMQIEWAKRFIHTGPL